LVAVTALAVMSVGLVGGAISWAALFEPLSIRRRLAASFLVSQVAKYAPGGGVSQAVGQIALASDDTISAKRAGARFLVHAAVQVSAGAVLASLLALDDALPAAVRVLLFCGLLTPLALTPSWMLWILARVSRLIGRQPPPTDSLPKRRAMLVSLAWALVSIVAASLIFGLILRDLEPGVDLLRASAAFSAAWVVGYLAVPFPAGLGVREAALVYLLPLSAGVVVAAAVVHRIVIMTAELIALVASWRTSH
jgi:hypothetical protein